MEYFKNDTEGTGVEGISIENGIGKVDIHGSITITPNENSLQSIDRLIKKLHDIRESISLAMETGEGIKEREPPEITPTEIVDNPFN